MYLENVSEAEEPIFNLNLEQEWNLQKGRINSHRAVHRSSVKDDILWHRDSKDMYEKEIIKKIMIRTNWKEQLKYLIENENDYG